MTKAIFLQGDIVKRVILFNTPKVSELLYFQTLNVKKRPESSFQTALYLHSRPSDWNNYLVYDKEVFIQRIKYVSKRGLVDLYDHQKHLFEAEPAPFVSSICKRLMEAKTIQKELSEGRSDQDVASQRGVSISHLKKILKLLKLPGIVFKHYT